MDNPLYTFHNLVPATFIKRENRFLAQVSIFEKNIHRKIWAHIPNSGRLTELLYKDNQLLIRFVRNQTRKTAWEVDFAKREHYWVLINTFLHNEIANNIIKNGLIPIFKDLSSIENEKIYENSRFDLLVHTKSFDYWLEIKGSTLFIGHTALFPDAPTQRGVKHIKELIAMKKAGINVGVMFLIFNNRIKYFKPNKQTDPQFAFYLDEAYHNGVDIFPVTITFKNNNLYFHSLLKY